MNDNYEKIIAEANRLEWDAIYSSKSSFNAAMIWNSVHFAIGGTAVIFGALATAQFSTPGSTAGAILSGISASLAAVITFLKPADRAKPHHKAGIEFGAIKREARMLQNISPSLNPDPESLLSELKSLAHKYTKIQKNSPPIFSLAYQITRRGVRKGEHKYNEEDEK